MTPRHRGLMPSLAFALALSLAVTPAPSLAEEGPKIIGVNLDGIGSIHTQWDFVDLMKNAEPWRPPAGQGGPLALDPLGNPLLAAGEMAETNVRLRVDNRITSYPTGTYTLTWEGAGQLFLTKDAEFTLADSTGGLNSRQVFIDTTGPANGTFMRINTSDPNDPIRNVRLFMPTYGPGEPNDGKVYHDLFIERIQPFGVTRYMDWTNANRNSIVSFDDRTTVNHNTYETEDGVPIEQMVALSNLTGNDPWFTMPARADDDYVRRFAEMVRDTLDPNRKVYVEYANEVWVRPINGVGGKEGGRFVTEQAIANGLNPDTEFHIQWAAEAMRDFDIWREVFEGQEDRVLRVAAAQAVNRFLSPMFFDAMYRDGERQFDVLSMTAYLTLGGMASTLDENTTANDVLDLMFANLATKLDPERIVSFPGQPFEIEGPRGDFLWHRELADQHGVTLIAYEGGLNVAPGSVDEPWFDAWVEAQRDPRMRELYEALLDGYLNVAGADGLLHFNSVSGIDQFGAFGLLEFQDQAIGDAPKYEALLAFIEAQGGAAIPEPGSLALLSAVGLGVASVRRRRGRMGQVQGGGGG